MTVCLVFERRVVNVDGNVYTEPMPAPISKSRSGSKSGRRAGAAAAVESKLGAWIELVNVNVNGYVNVNRCDVNGCRCEYAGKTGVPGNIEQITADFDNDFDFDGVVYTVW